VGTTDSLCGVFELLTETISLTLSGDPPPGTSTSPALTETSQGRNIGVIAGATVAAVIALLAFVGAFLWYRHKQRIRSLAAMTVEPLPLTTTNLSPTTPTQAPETRMGAPERTISTPSQAASAEVPAKAHYRGNTIPSMLSGSGSSGVVSSSTGARNIPPTIYSPRSYTTAATTIPPSPPHSPHPLLPPPSYAAAASDLRIHEVHSDSE